MMSECKCEWIRFVGREGKCAKCIAEQRIAALTAERDALKAELYETKQNWITAWNNAQNERDQLREQLTEERLTSEDEARKRDEHFAEIGRLRTALRETREALKNATGHMFLVASMIPDHPTGKASGDYCERAKAVLARYAGLVEEVGCG